MQPSFITLWALRPGIWAPPFLSGCQQMLMRLRSKALGEEDKAYFQLTSPSEGLKMGSYPDKQNKDVKKASWQLGIWRQSCMQIHLMKMMTSGSAGHRDSFGEKMTSNLGENNHSGEKGNGY